MRYIYLLVEYSSPFCKCLALKFTLIRDQGWINFGAYGSKSRILNTNQADIKL